MDANFKPNQNEYKNIGKFRFWCQQVLPLCFDNSLSYYEVLNKVTHYLNETIENMSACGEDVTNMYMAYGELQEYVNTYFSELDVEEEIERKIDGLVDDGTMNRLITPFLSKQNPVFVNSTAKMTDRNVAYVNTGDEYIYTWNGSSFTSTGLKYSAPSNLIAGDKELYYSGQVVTPYNDFDTLPVGSVIRFLTSWSNIPHSPKQFLNGTVMTFNYINDSTVGGTVQIAYSGTLPKVCYRIKWGAYGADQIYSKWNSLVSMSDLVEILNENGIKAGVNEIVFDMKNAYTDDFVISTGYLAGYDTGTFLPIVNENELWKVINIDLAQISTFSFPCYEQSEYPSSFVCCMYGDGKAQNYAYSSLTSGNLTWCKVEKGLFNLDKLWYFTGQGFSHMAVVVKANCQSLYVPADINDYIPDNAISVNKIKNVHEIITTDKIYVAPGETFILYPGNVLLNGNIDKYSCVDFVVSGITDYDKRDNKLYISGDSVTAGAFVDINLFENNDESVTITKRIYVYKVTDNVGKTGTWSGLIIGDSNIAGCQGVQTLLDKMDSAGYNFNLLGTKPGRGETDTMSSSLHSGKIYPNTEGKPGWNWYAFTHALSHQNLPNNFYQTGVGFNFSYYMAQNNYSNLDFVMLACGTNAVTVPVAGHTPTYEEDLEALKDVVASIRNYSSSIKIMIFLCTPIAQTNGSWCRRENDKRLKAYKNYIAEFSGRESENIFIVPGTIIIDPVYGFNVNGRYGSTVLGDGGRPVFDGHWIKETNTSDILHYNDYGGLQVGGLMYSYFRYMINLKATS